MDDSDKKNQNKIFREKAENGDLQGHDPIPGSIFQSFWFRCRSIFPNITDGRFMESELRYVLYCGAILWIAHLLSKVIF